MTTSLYKTLMGPAFDHLAPAVQDFHRLQGTHELHGVVRTDAPASWLGKLLARCLGTPLTTSEGPIRFELNASASRESWVRHFPESTMRSCLGLEGAHLWEQLGMSRLEHTLTESDGRLVMRLNKLYFLGIPCPRWAMPCVTAEEAGIGDRLYFKIRAFVPGLGQVVGYRGYLTIPSAGTALQPR